MPEERLEPEVAVVGAGPAGIGHELLDRSLRDQGLGSTRGEL